VNLALTGSRIVVSISQRRLTLYQNGSAVYTSLVGVGAPQWPTPMGLTFVDAVVATPKFQEYIYGPTVLILGAHSNVFTDFDGGNGTVAIHGYPSDPGSTDGVAVSHGCVRASPQTINAIDTVPLGSPVDIVA
jgi:lipoprotein-anchoring transpeptidase ErfK/SrfK